MSCHELQDQEHYALCHEQDVDNGRDCRRDTDEVQQPVPDDYEQEAAARVVVEPGQDDGDGGDQGEIREVAGAKGPFGDEELDVPQSPERSEEQRRDQRAESALKPGSANPRQPTSSPVAAARVMPANASVASTGGR